MFAKWHRRKCHAPRFPDLFCYKWMTKILIVLIIKLIKKQFQNTNDIFIVLGVISHYYRLWFSARSFILNEDLTKNKSCIFCLLNVCTYMLMNARSTSQYPKRATLFLSFFDVRILITPFSIFKLFFKSSGLVDDIICFYVDKLLPSICCAQYLLSICDLLRTFSITSKTNR